MKYYSDILNKLYTSEQELKNDEKNYNEKVAAEKARKEKLSSERAARAKEIEEAGKVIMEAKKLYREKVDAFIKDYGSYHSTIKSCNGEPFNLFDLFFN